MQTLKQKYPTSCNIGPNFKKCLTAFSSQQEMSRAVFIPDSSLNHIVHGRAPRNDKTVRRYESLCRAYLDKIDNQPQPSEPEPDKPTQAALDLDQTKVFLVSVPAAKADKLKTVLAMFGAEIVELD